MGLTKVPKSITLCQEKFILHNSQEQTHGQKCACREVEWMVKGSSVAVTMHIPRRVYSSYTIRLLPVPFGFTHTNINRTVI
jgi:hypothetical protein